jgi:aspartate/glutamate racemase
VDATLALFDGKEKPRRVGIIATQGTLDAGWFQHVWQRRGLNPYADAKTNCGSGLCPAAMR